MSRKYKLLKWETLVVKNQKDEDIVVNARRIQALRDIPRHNVKAGDIGGYVNSGMTLSHKGDCWIGGNAKVLKSIVTLFSYIRVKGNALIDKNAEVLLFPRSNGTEIYISIDSKVLITDSSRVIANSSSSYLTGNFKARGKSFLHNVSRCSGNAEITGSAQVKRIHISENSSISGDAFVDDKCIISGDAKISGNAFISQECEIGDRVIIKDKARVGTKAKIFGSLSVDGDTFVPQQSSLNDLNTQKYESAQRELPENSSTARPSHSIKIFNDIKASIENYQKDIINLIKYPTMSDLTDEHTLEMFASLKESELYDPEHEAPEFKESVSNLMRKFMAAESNARKISLSKMDDEAKAKIETASKMFKIASNEASSETDKKNAFVQGFKKLEGVMAIPDAAVEEFRIKIGLPELEELQ